jgi:hypothetical protein
MRIVLVYGGIGVWGSFQAMTEAMVANMVTTTAAM